MALTAQKQLFADRYIVLNDGRVGAGAQAARDAGYAKASAAQQASRLLKDADVIAYLRDRVSPVMTTAPTIVNGKMEADEVLTRLTGIGRGDVKPFLANIGVAFPDDAPTHLIKRLKIKTRTIEDVTETETEVELHDPLTALNMLGKHLRLFDRANEDDWRRQFEDAGIDPDDFREYMISKASERIEAETK